MCPFALSIEEVRDVICISQEGRTGMNSEGTRFRLVFSHYGVKGVYAPSRRKHERMDRVQDHDLLVVVLETCNRAERLKYAHRPASSTHITSLSVMLREGFTCFCRLNTRARAKCATPVVFSAFRREEIDKNAPRQCSSLLCEAPHQT